MKWFRYLVLLTCVVGAGCATDGGPVGTGISSTSAISGNVVDVQTTTATTSSALPPIAVSVDGIPSATTMADANGNFALRGNFDGTVTLRFTVPDFQVTQQLDVPAGSAVVLQDIELQPDGVVARGARQLDFFGTVDLVDCADGTLLVHERRANGMQFLVHLNDQTSFIDTAGGSEACTSIAVGTTVEIEGSVAYATDRTISALTVTIGAPPPPPPPQLIDARFAGAIAALDCMAGSVVVDDSVQRTRIQLTPQTQIVGAAGALTCMALQLGAPVHGQGQINLRAPGVITATRLVVAGPPNLGRPLHFVGFVSMIDCVSGALQLRDVKTTIDLQLSATTVITRKNGQALTCAAIQVGDRIEGMGQAAPDGSGTLEATQIAVTHRGPGNMAGR